MIAELKERNISVSKPIGDNERYDIIAGVPNGDLLRIQIKTGRYDNGTVIFDGASQRTNSSGNRYVPYGGEVDYFIVYSHRFDSLYLVEANRVNGKMRLRVEKPKSNHPSINWAEDFDFDRNWPPGGDSDIRVGSSMEELPTNRKGDATETRVIAELLRRRVSLAIPPTDNERFDLILQTTSGDSHRIQVKTGWITNGCVTFQGVSSHVNSSGVVYKPYEDDIDYFLVYEPTQEEMYLIPEGSFHSAIFLRIDDSKQKDRTAHNAEDFLFDRNWPPEPSQRNEKPRTRPAPNEVQSTVVETLSTFGGIVSEPIASDSPYDCIVETSNGNVVRCAIKTAQLKDGRIFFNPENEFQERDFDQYILYCYDLEELYLIDPHLFESSLTLRIDEPSQIRHKTQLAEVYELERQWPPTGSHTVPMSLIVGEAVEAFHALGIEVAYPAERDCSSDIFVRSSDDQLLKVAIEPGWISNGRIRLKPDSKQGIDYFLLACREIDTYYLLGADEFDVSAHLRIDPPKRDDGTVRYAEDYELSSRWPIDLPR